MVKKGFFASIIAITLLLMCGCKNNNNNTQAQATPSDNSGTAHTAAIDSLLYEFKGDSIKLLATRVIKNSAGGDEQQIVVMDYTLNQKLVDDMKNMPANQLSAYRGLTGDTTTTGSLNPYTELNGIYTQVFFYKGTAVTADGDDEGGEQSSLISIISDSCINDVYEMPFIGLYQNTTRSNGVTKFITRRLGEPEGYNDTIEIKTLSPATGLQLWRYRRSGETSFYQFKMPLVKTSNMPMVISRNTIGLGEDDFIIELDKANCDSLFNLK